MRILHRIVIPFIISIIFRSLRSVVIAFAMLRLVILSSKPKTLYLVFMVAEIIGRVGLCQALQCGIQRAFLYIFFSMLLIFYVFFKGNNIIKKLI